MHKKNIAALLLAGAVAFSLALSGCTPIEEQIDIPSLKYQTEYPSTEEEYNLRISQKIVPFLNTMQGHIAKSRDILNGEYPVANEIDSVDDTLNYLNDIYEGCKVIYPPEGVLERHQDTLMQMQRAINSVEVYKETLQATTDLSDAKQAEDIQSAANIMKSEYTSLKNMFNVV